MCWSFGTLATGSHPEWLQLDGLQSVNCTFSAQINYNINVIISVRNFITSDIYALLHILA